MEAYYKRVEKIPSTDLILLDIKKSMSMLFFGQRATIVFPEDAVAIPGD